MPAQSSTQLYRELVARDWDDASLALVRNAYQRARVLFGDSYRPSGRHYLCHLTGTASLLAAWTDSPALACAGLVHSAYLYGRFDDGAKKLTTARREKLAGEIGVEAEELLVRYAEAKRSKAFTGWSSGATEPTAADRPIIVMLLADLCDEALSGDPAFAPKKRYEPGLPYDPAKQAAVVALAERVAGPVPAAELRRAFDELNQLVIPAGLTSSHVCLNRETTRRSPLRKVRDAWRQIRIASGLKKAA